MLPSPATIRWSSSAALIGVILPASSAARYLPSKPGFERLGPHAGEERVRDLLAAPHVIHQPEAARVVEAHDRAVVEGQHDMVVRARPRHRRRGRR